MRYEDNFRILGILLFLIFLLMLVWQKDKRQVETNNFNNVLVAKDFNDFFTRAEQSFEALGIEPYPVVYTFSNNEPYNHNAMMINLSQVLTRLYSLELKKMRCSE